MKVAVTGKGGVGKTTFASTLCRLYAAEGRNVLAADVDPDANLGLALGLTEEEVNAIVPVSKMKELAKERTGANASNTFFKLNPEVKFCFGLTDVLQHKRPDLADDPEMIKITDSLKKVKSSMIVITFNFE